MARPRELDLTSADQPWRRVPMDGANTGLDVVPLASHPDDFVILARFPAGFVRDVPGGYHAAESFLVIDGELVLEGRTARRGDLTYVPAEHLRAGMSTEDGCTVLAWFSGPPTFLAPGELLPSTGEVTTVTVEQTAAGPLLTTPEADWVVTRGGGEGVDGALDRWAVDTADFTGLVLSRRRR